MESFYNIETFLSPKVCQLVCKIGTTSIDEDEAILVKKCLDEEGLIGWSYLEQVVFDGIDFVVDANNFEELVRRLAPVCQVVCSHVTKLSVEDFKCAYLHKLQWTGMNEVFMEALKAARSDTVVGNSVCLLLLTAALERALGDVFLTKSSPCPSMLKDLLATEELKQMLGNFVIFCLRVLIGPPTSLNLRNVVWHGFASPQDIPTRYASFLFVLAASIGAILDENLPGCNISHRPALSLHQQMSDIKGFLPDINHSELCYISRLFSKSTCIAKVMLPYWDHAIKYYKEERYGICVILLLTQLEQSLRQICAAANHCPQRVLTAASSVLFTTFDEMLCPTLPDGTDNALVQKLGTPVVEMLLDLIEHQEGPRLRDHISHGELDILNIPKDVAVYALMVSSVLCVAVKDGGDASSSEECDIHDKLHSLTTRYTSIFHPLSRLKSELMECIASLTSWNDLSHPSHDALEHILWCTYTDEAFTTSNVYTSAKFILAGATEDNDRAAILRCLNAFSGVDSLQSVCMKCKLLTLFRPRSELEVGALLRRIVQEVRVVIVNVSNRATARYHQWEEKNLRSRQRNNYVRLLNNLPQFSSGLRLAVFIAVWEMKKVNQVSSHATVKLQMLIKFLKSVLQYTENLAILTSPSKNRWEECCQLTTTLVDKVTVFYTKINQ